MDVNDLRAVLTVVSFVAFIGIAFWAYSGKRQKAFDEAAMLPFADDEPEAGQPSPGRHP
jgi:cytochrome c oxidase cbb3-type subunit 4